MLTENLKMKTWTEAAKVNTKTVNTYSKAVSINENFTNEL